jgi:hypothetical protein
MRIGLRDLDQGVTAKVIKRVQEARKSRLYKKYRRPAG